MANKHAWEHDDPAGRVDNFLQIRVPDEEIERRRKRVAISVIAAFEIDPRADPLTLARRAGEIALGIPQPELKPQPQSQPHEQGEQ